MRSRIYLLYFAVFITIIGFGMVIPMLPFYAQRFGATAEQLGLLAASFSIGQFLAAPIIGRISDKYGRKPILIIAVAGTSLAFFIIGSAQELWQVFASRFLHGICSAGAFPIAAAYIGDVTTKDERIKYMSRLTGTLSLSFIIGPAVAGFASEQNAVLPFFMASVLSFLNTVFIALFLPESIKNRAEKVHIKEGFVNVKRMAKSLRGEFGVLFFLLTAWAFAISNSQVAFPLFSEGTFSFTTREVGIVFAFTAVVSAVMQWVILPRTVKFLGEYKTVIIGVFVMGMAQFFVPLSLTVIIMLIFMSFSSVGGSMLRPTINALISKNAVEGQGSTMGLAFSFESLGRILGPLIAGVVIHFYGPESQYFLTSVILFVGFFLLIKMFPLIMFRYIKSNKIVKKIIEAQDITFSNK